MCGLRPSQAITSGVMRASHRQAAPGAPDGVLVHYKRYRPEQTTLQHVATFFAQAEAASGADLPQS